MVFDCNQECSHSIRFSKRALCRRALRGTLIFCSTAKLSSYLNCLENYFVNLDLGVSENLLEVLQAFAIQEKLLCEDAVSEMWRYYREVSEVGWRPYCSWHSLVSDPYSEWLFNGFQLTY